MNVTLLLYCCIAKPLNRTCTCTKDRWVVINLAVISGEMACYCNKDSTFLRKADKRIKESKILFNSRKIRRILLSLFYSSCMAAAKERKENFLSLYISFFERNMHNNKLLCLYRTYLRYVLTKIFDLCIRISKAYSYEDKQSLSSYKTRSSILSNKRIFDPFVVK